VEEAHTIEVEAAREMNLDIPEEIDLEGNEAEEGIEGKRRRSVSGRLSRIASSESKTWARLSAWAGQ
jgi:hypothetical protein